MVLFSTKKDGSTPIEALRELLLNCMVHRDYKNFSDIVIKIFDNRIVFTNPGRLYGDLRLSDLERDDYVSSLHNRLLAEAFYLTGDIERYGTGFVRIRENLAHLIKNIILPSLALLALLN